MAEKKPAGQWSGAPETPDAQPSGSAMALSAKLAVKQRKTTKRKIKPPAPPEPTQRERAYQLSLQLSSHVFTVVELASMERYSVRDRLEKISMALPHALLRAQAMPQKNERVRAYEGALNLARECMSIIDILGARGTVEPEPIAAARKAVRELEAMLVELARWH